MESVSKPRNSGSEPYELSGGKGCVKFLRGARGADRAMLAEIYHWFTEGFDTADLKHAKALLEQFKD